MEVTSVEKIITVTPEQVKAEVDALCILQNGEWVRFPWNVLSKRLANATFEQKVKFKLSPSGYGIRWNEIDEDISIYALLK